MNILPYNTNKDYLNVYKSQITKKSFKNKYF